MKDVRITNEEALYMSQYYASRLMGCKFDQTYIVWFSKTLQNFKAMVSTDAVAGKYVEITYNGDKDELYADLYTKQSNNCYVNPSCIFEGNTGS